MKLKTLVIVESPSKATTIQKYLGEEYIILASKGHIEDLAKGGKWGIGIDINNNFRPHYILLGDKLKILDDIISATKKCKRVLIATDNDREGEAIAYSIYNRIKDIDKPIKRIVFNEIKKKVILKAIENASDINMDIVYSQMARRILDRIVGFSASPFLMNFFGSHLSAGRVQSAVSRMIVDREHEIEAFVPEDFWTIQIKLNDGKDEFLAKYSEKLSDQATADAVKNKLDHPNYLVSKVEAASENRYPSPPLITSSLQRLMSKKNGFGAERTMKAAQSLYEAGLCTYIRTDSVRAGEESIVEVREWLVSNKYPIPSKPPTYKNKEATQDAHECIRPTDLSLLPWDNYVIANPDEKAVYEAIWRYFVASQMNPAVYDTLVVMAHPEKSTNTKVKASGKALKIKGFLEILGVQDEGGIDIPNLVDGQQIFLSKEKSAVKMEKKQTQPPPRYSEDRLIKELVSKGIGRPATYAQLLGKITDRNYVEKRGNVFHATELGKKINGILIKFFTFMDYGYTAELEKQLDEIESGKISHLEMLNKFYPAFQKEIERAYIEHGSCLCEKCNSPMVERNNKQGQKFLACSSFPKCRQTKSISQVA